MKTDKIVLVILFFHFLFIFLLSSTAIGLPSDMLENLVWGRDFTFTYDKHPPLFAWESHYWVKLFNGSLLFYRALSPLNTVIMLWCVFVLNKKIFGEEKALLALILSQGIIFYAFYYKFNANTANYWLFGIFYLVFYNIVKERKYFLYPLLGFVEALIMLTKYSGIMAIGLTGIVTLITSEGRKSMKSFWFYSAILTFIITLIPHLYSLVEEPGAINYMILQSDNVSRTRLAEFFRFISLQILFLLPFLITCIAIGKNFSSTEKKFNFYFLTLCGVFPVIIIGIYILLTGASVGSFWLSMYYILTPTLFLYLFKIRKNSMSVATKIILPIWIIVFIACLIGALANWERDIPSIVSFVEEVESKHGKINEFICNDKRNMCGTILLNSKDTYQKKLQMNMWGNKDIFQNTSSKIIMIIGEREKINLPLYNLYRYDKKFSKFLKYKIFENFYNNPPSFLISELSPMKEDEDLVLTVAVRKDYD
jgi:4-amino-4-deoxy-L-arabinose transferase-like glycosyltransferase